MPDKQDLESRVLELEHMVMRLQNTVIGMSEILGSLIEYVEGEEDLTPVEYGKH